MGKKIIVIAGKAGSGKDTFTGILRKKLMEKLHTYISTIAFADHIKFICKRYGNWDGNKDEFGRSLLQNVGTDITHNLLYPEYWADMVVNTIRIMSSYMSEYIIITDLRYKHEEHVIRTNFGESNVTTIRIDSNRKSELNDEQKKHSSESELNNHLFDFYVNNIGSIDDLEEYADAFIMQLIGD